MTGYIVKHRGAASLVARDFACAAHGPFDALVGRLEEGAQPCPACGASSPMVPSAPLGRVKRGEVTQGKVEAAPSPYALDTRPLADGMPLREWKAQRSKLWNEKRRRDLKDKIG